MNDTRGYGSEKKKFHCVFEPLNKGIERADTEQRKKMRQDFAEFHRYNCCSLFIVARFSLLLAMMSTLSRRHILPFQQGRINFHIISIFYFMHIVIYQIGILRRTSPLCSNKKTLYVPIKVGELLEFNLTSFKLQFRAKYEDNKLKNQNRIRFDLHTSKLAFKKPNFVN